MADLDDIKRSYQGRDYVNTNILNSENKGLIITQDIIVTLAITSAVEKVVYGTIYNFGGKQALNIAFRRYNHAISKKTLQKLQQGVSGALMKNISKRMTQLFAGRAANKVGTEVAKAASKQALKQGAKTIGTSAAKSGARSAAITAGGCAAGPAGCAAGAVIGGIVFMADLAFTIFNTILDIKDDSGILTLFHKDYVDRITKDFDDALRAAFTEMDYPEAMDEKVLFYPEMFVYDFDEEGVPYFDERNEWVDKYIEYENEYLRSIGIEDGWEYEINASDMTDIFQGIFSGLGDNKDKDDNFSIVSLSSSSLSCILLLLFSIVLVT
jgi:hypothetical protein